jgi:hypothetical protein
MMPSFSSAKSPVKGLVQQPSPMVGTPVQFPDTSPSISTVEKNPTTGQQVPIVSDPEKTAAGDGTQISGIGTPTGTTVDGGQPSRAPSTASIVAPSESLPDNQIDSDGTAYNREADPSSSGRLFYRKADWCMRILALSTVILLMYS